MALHRASGRRGLGFALALCTMLLWGALPIALQGVLRQLDPPTIVWARFLASAALLFAFLLVRGRLPRLARLESRAWVLLVVATSFLAANYLCYLVGLHWSSPANAQVMIQLAPLLLALGGILVFRERFAPLQWAGFAVLVTGLALFSVAKLGADAAAAGSTLRGTGMIVLAAVTWAVYGLAQKQLLHTLASHEIMLCIYVGCALIFWPLAAPAQLGHLDALGAGLLAFCALNTLAAYGAFSEALEHWEASRVSAVLALTPLWTLALTGLVGALWPGFLDPDALPPAALLGAALVVAGSLGTSLGGRDQPPTLRLRRVSPESDDLRQLPQ
jgi:drug/metabolite transporter (DMT)-like permease